MLYQMQRHLLPIEAELDDTLVLTYATAPRLIEPLLSPGMSLDLHKGRALVAVAMTQASAMRVAGLPRWMGQDRFLGGLRTFVRFRDGDGITRRGLRILTSYTDSAPFSRVANVLTQYNYRQCAVVRGRQAGVYRVNLVDEAGQHLLVRAHLDEPGGLPAGSIFDTAAEARRFAGPLPRTVSYEAETGRLIVVKGHRTGWQPRLVDVEVWRNGLLSAAGLRPTDVQLASAFYVEHVPYRWDRGSIVSIPAEQPIEPTLTAARAAETEAEHAGRHAA